MATDITTWFVQQYERNVMHLMQQEGSRLRDTVSVKTGIVGKAYYWDQLGVDDDVQDITSRHADTIVGDATHNRRQLTIFPKTFSRYVDEEDEIRMLADPTSAYATAGAWAMGRKIDRLIITAMRGTANTDETGSTAVALPSSQKVAAASAGLTIAKLITAAEILNSAEAPDDGNRYFAYSARQLTNLLNTTQVTSADYASVKALVNGTIKEFMGFKFIRTQLLTLSGGIRYCMAWHKNSMKLGIGRDVTTEIERLPQKNYTTQVYLKMHLGASRSDETGVVEVACTES